MTYQQLLEYAFGGEYISFDEYIQKTESSFANICYVLNKIRAKNKSFDLTFSQITI